MKINEGKQTVVKAGIQLVKSGLIARTWGNVSCRVDEKSFVITPSGIDYLSLSPDKIVKVNIEDLSYGGNIKPSSEKGIHAEVYKLHPEVNFVIHTHQENASAVAVLGLDSIKIKKDYPLLTDEVICAKYALPGTKSLCKNVANALAHSKGKAVIMKNHGALCFGKDYKETFMVASELEKACEDFVVSHYLNLSKKTSFNPLEMSIFALSQNSKLKLDIPKESLKTYCSSERTKKGFILYKNGGKMEIKHDNIDTYLPEEAKIYSALYEKNENINYIVFKNTPEIFAVSSLGLKLKPLLDDFAQIVGLTVINVQNNPMQISHALKKSSAVFIKNIGALCCGKTKDDANAVSMIMQKSCKAFIYASMFGKVKPINPLECMLMRFVYLKKYSKLAN